jgi:hypothetical protein
MDVMTDMVLSFGHQVSTFRQAPDNLRSKFKPSRSLSLRPKPKPRPKHKLVSRRIQTRRLWMLLPHLMYPALLHRSHLLPSRKETGAYLSLYPMYLRYLPLQDLAYSQREYQPRSVPLSSLTNGSSVSDSVIFLAVFAYLQGADGLVDDFRSFVKNEKTRLTEKRQALVKNDLDKRKAELLKFSQSFKV